MRAQLALQKFCCWKKRWTKRNHSLSLCRGKLAHYQHTALVPGQFWQLRHVNHIVLKKLPTLPKRLCSMSPMPAVTWLWDQSRRGPSWVQTGHKGLPRFPPGKRQAHFERLPRLWLGRWAFGLKYTISLDCHVTIWRSFVITTVRGLVHTPSSSWRRTRDNYHENSIFIYSNTKKVLNSFKSCKIAFLNRLEFSNKIGNNCQESVLEIQYFIPLEVNKLLTSACQEGRAVFFPWSSLS